jgi:glucose/arabinose dehydrogenase
MRSTSIGVILATIAWSATAATALAVVTGATRVASGLSAPIYATHAPGDTSRLFIVERGGSIRILDLTTGSLVPQPFLSNLPVDTAGEGGLLSMAFHPNFAENGRFYISATVDNNNLTFQGASGDMTSVIREYTVNPRNPNTANTSFTEVYSWIQPQSNHNGGWIGFSPIDNYLYIATGDGGGGNDNATWHTPGIGNAQDLTNNPHGKMLRIDVDGDDFPTDSSRTYAIPSDNPFVGVTGDDEIWAYGLRNPWRNSFDRLTGDLWIADVGQNVREEVNFQAADSVGGENYGWRLREGSIATPSGGVGGPAPAGAIDPVHEYLHTSGTSGGFSITGGYVYRGPDASLRGDYYFADYVTANIWRFDSTNPTDLERINPLLTTNVGSISSISSFGEDADGNLYIMDLNGGEVFRIDTTIMITGDYDGNGVVDAGDYQIWRSQYGEVGTTFAADGNQDGVVDAADYTIWRDNLGRSLPGASLVAGAVPEPQSLMLLCGLVALCRLVRQCRV